MLAGPNSDPQEIFGIALDLTAGARAAYLDRACAQSAALRREVESLLQSHQLAAGFLQAPATSGGELAEESADLAGACIGRYRVLETIGAGGMGAVYRAVRADGEYDQQVAVKVMRSNAIGPSGLRRFLQERQTLAQLDHPHITRLIDAGSTADHKPYLVMEYVEGIPITEEAWRNKRGVADRLELFRKVCDAVHHAHTRLVIHRDLKPANILVTAAGLPKVLDFGIAKMMGDAAGGVDITGSQPRPMTPRYASPEQIRGEPMTTAADVYSLGVVLYELLAGIHPYHDASSSAFDLARRICEDDPPRPSQSTGAAHANGHARDLSVVRNRAGRELRGDLDNIVMMAMQKDPARRYGSVQQLSEDIERYLSRRPVLARQDTLAYRVSKWLRRNRAVAGVSVALGIVLVVGITGTTAGMMKAQSARARAEREKQTALQARQESEVVTAFLQGLLITSNPYRHGRERPVREMLGHASARIKTELAGMPAAEAAVRLAIGQTYAGLWEWASAAGHLRVALDLNRQLYGNDDARVATALSLLGRAYTFQRDAEAVELQREGLRIRRQVFGDASPEVAESTGNLGFALWHATPGRPRHKAAERCYREALALYDQLGVHDDPDVARFSFSLAVMLKSLGRHAESEKLFLEALDIYATLPVTQDCYRVQCLTHYAELLEATGRTAEAEQAMAEAVALAPDLAVRGP